MPSCTLSATELFYAEKGAGVPLVFLNGLSGDHMYWTGQLRIFSKRYRCIALDNRDVGRSRYAAAPYSIRELAGDVAEVFEHLNLSSAHVVGLSMGGMIAQELALARPELVRSLVLVDTLGRADEWFKRTLRAFALIRGQVPDTAAFFEAILPWWVSDNFLDDSDRVAWLCWLLRQNPYPQRLEGFLRQIEAMQQHDASDRLHLIRCPVSIIVGEDDCVSPPRYSRELREQLTGASLVELPNIGHAPPLEDPGRFNSLLAECLTGTNLEQRRPA